MKSVLTGRDVTGGVLFGVCSETKTFPGEQRAVSYLLQRWSEENCLSHQLSAFTFLSFFLFAKSKPLAYFLHGSCCITQLCASSSLCVFSLERLSAPRSLPPICLHASFVAVHVCVCVASCFLWITNQAKLSQIPNGS